MVWLRAPKEQLTQYVVGAQQRADGLVQVLNSAISGYRESHDADAVCRALAQDHRNA